MLRRSADPFHNNTCGGNKGFSTSSNFRLGIEYIHVLHLYICLYDTFCLAILILCVSRVKSNTGPFNTLGDGHAYQPLHKVAHEQDLSQLSKYQVHKAVKCIVSMLEYIG